MANFLQTKFVALCFSLSLHIILYGVTSYMILIFLWISFHDSISFDLIYPSSHPLAFLYSSFSLSLFLFSSSRFFFSCCFSFTRRISSSGFLKRLRNNRRHTNCDQWKVSAWPLRSKDHLHSIRTKQTSQGFYITCHNGRTILDISVMKITEEKLQKLISGSEILALKKIRTGTHIIFKTCCFFFWVLKILHQLSLVNFFSICFVTTWLFPFNDSRSEWFLWGFQAGTSAQGGAWDTWIHERKRRRCDGRLKMDMVPKPWRLLCRGEFYWHPDGIFHVGRIRNNACVLLFENHLAICLATHDPLREVWADLTPERFIMIFIYSPSFVRSNDRPGRWWAVYFIEGTSMTRQISSCRSHSYLSFSLGGHFFHDAKLGNLILVKIFEGLIKLKNWLIFKYSLVGLGYSGGVIAWWLSFQGELQNILCFAGLRLEAATTTNRRGQIDASQT